MGHGKSRPSEMLTLDPIDSLLGTYFFFSQYIMHRSAEHFPRTPLRFDPGTLHLRSKARMAAQIYLLPLRRWRTPMHWRGLLHGMEGVLILATIGQRWKLNLVPGQQVDVQPKITLRPKYPILVVPELRHA